MVWYFYLLTGSLGICLLWFCVALFCLLLFRLVIMLICVASLVGYVVTLCDVVRLLFVLIVGHLFTWICVYIVLVYYRVVDLIVFVLLGICWFVEVLHRLCLVISGGLLFVGCV